MLRVPPLADRPLVDQLVRAVFPWCQAKMRPAFARAREPSRIVDGDLKAIDARAPAPEAVIRRRQTGSTRTQRPCALLLPTRNGELLRWSMQNGFRLVHQMTLMSIGLYNEPTGAYLPSVLY